LSRSRTSDSATTSPYPYHNTPTLMPFQLPKISNPYPTPRSLAPSSTPGNPLRPAPNITPCAASPTAKQSTLVCTYHLEHAPIFPTQSPQSHVSSGNPGMPHWDAVRRTHCFILIDSSPGSFPAGLPPLPPLVSEQTQDILMASSHQNHYHLTPISFTLWTSRPFGGNWLDGLYCRAHRSCPRPEYFH
jgi:hypothetical protein